MREATLWRYLRDGLRPLRVDLSRHEDMAEVGVPDVSYGARGVNGWIELKHVKKWTRNGVKVPWRPGQREWLMQRGRQGGRCWLLIRVGRSNYLFAWNALPPNDHTRWSQQEYDQSCHAQWDVGDGIWSELLEVLTK